MKKNIMLFCSALLLGLSAQAIAESLGPFEITLPDDDYGNVTLNDTDLTWIDQNPSKDGTQIDVVVTLRANMSGIDVTATPDSSIGQQGDMGSYQYSKNDTDVDFSIVYVHRVGDGIQVQLIVTKSQCGSIPCADYNGTNGNKLYAKNNFPVGRLITLALQFNDGDGNNLNISYGSNNLPNWRKMYDAGPSGVLELNPILTDALLPPPV